MDWGSFWTGVAVTVVGGLILYGLVGGPRWYVKRRERQAKEAERRLEQRAWLVGTSGEVARELRENAAVAKRCEEGYHVSTEAKFASLGVGVA